MKKTRLKVDPKTRAVVKEPVAETKPADSIDLPAPEPIKLQAGIPIPKNGNNTPAPAPASSGSNVGAPEAMKVALEKPPGLKLDLACGQSPKDGFEGVDLLAPGVKHKVDLWKFPWPWDDNSVDELHCSHFIEHIPDREIVETDLTYAHLPVGRNKADEGKKLRERWIGQDMFFAFFDECYRILKPNGDMSVICPSVRSERAFQDPTHRRFIAQATFFYLSSDWRKANKLDHYKVRCNFSGNVNFSFPIDYQSRHDEVRNELFAHAWNVILDWTVVLKAIK